MRFSNKLTIAITALATAATFAFSACNRLKKDAADEDTGYAADHATLEKNFSDVQSIADEADDAGTGGSMASYRMAGGGPTVLGQCASITKDTLSATHNLTIDFGASNCLCKDGNYRRGKIIVTYTGRYRDMGHTHTISFDGYYVNDNQVMGAKTVSYTSNDPAGNPKYDISVDGQIILASGAGTISWTSTHTRTWLQGFNTKDWSDDVYEISGSGNVTRANGNTFAILITTPLHVALNCNWIESGIVQITPQGGSVRTLDYGNGACDDLADLTANGKTRSVTLRK